MKPILVHPFIEEYFRRPLGVIRTHQRGYLVHPGSTLPPQRLGAGWHWHWPILTSLRVIHFEPVIMDFGEDKNPQSIFHDEPITLVSRDHVLFSSYGQITLQLDQQADDLILAKFNHHSVNRLIRPLIRQAIRQAAAHHSASELSSETIAQKSQQILQMLAAKYGIIILRVDIDRIISYQPQFNQKP